MRLSPTLPAGACVLLLAVQAVFGQGSYGPVGEPQSSQPDASAYGSATHSDNMPLAVGSMPNEATSPANRVNYHSDDQLSALRSSMDRFEASPTWPAQEESTTAAADGYDSQYDVTAPDATPELSNYPVQLTSLNVPQPMVQQVQYTAPVHRVSMQDQNGQQAAPGACAPGTFGSSYDDSCYGDSCYDDACCGTSGCRSESCCYPKWIVYGQYMYLRPGNEEVSYGVPIDSTGPAPPDTPIQVGREGVADIDFDSGFKVGFARSLSACSSIGAEYTHFESDVESQMSVTAPGVIRSLVMHPSTANAAADFLDARARYDIDFQIGDINYRRIISNSECHELNWLIGGRYVNLQQDFRSVFTNSTTREIVTTDITFDGGGIRVGLEGERRGSLGLMVYGRGYASFVGGKFNSDYTQSDNFAGTVVSGGWQEDRVVSILDLEVGVGWVSPKGRFRFTGGYMFSGWYNVLNTDELIQAIQTNNTTAVGDTISFDGFVARGEVRY